MLLPSTATLGVCLQLKLCCVTFVQGVDTDHRAEAISRIRPKLEDFRGCDKLDHYDRAGVGEALLQIIDRIISAGDKVMTTYSIKGHAQGLALRL